MPVWVSHYLQWQQLFSLFNMKSSANSLPSRHPSPVSNHCLTLHLSRSSHFLPTRLVLLLYPPNGHIQCFWDRSNACLRWTLFIDWWCCEAFPDVKCIITGFIGCYKTFEVHTVLDECVKIYRYTYSWKRLRTDHKLLSTQFSLSYPVCLYLFISLYGSDW